MRLTARFISVLLLLGCVLSTSGCSKLWIFKKTAYEDENSYIYHTISKPGETLAKISLWYTGDIDNWRLILSSNPGLEERNLRIGQEIRIPKWLAVNKRPMNAKDQGRDGGRSSGRVSSKSPPSIPTDDTPLSDRVVEYGKSTRSMEETVKVPSAAATSVEQRQNLEAPRVPEAKPVEQASTPMPLDENGRSVDDLIREEKAAIEKLKNELNLNNQTNGTGGE